MADITTIGAALSSIKTAADIAKIIKDSSSSLEQAEIKLKIAELIGALADAKIEMAEIQEILLSKDKELADLANKLKVQDSVVWEKPYYWVEDDDGFRDGPFCQQCYDTESKLIRLQSNFTGKWHCKTCDSVYKDGNYKPSSGIRVF